MGRSKNEIVNINFKFYFESTKRWKIEHPFLNQLAQLLIVLWDLRVSAIFFNALKNNKGYLKALLRKRLES